MQSVTWTSPEHGIETRYTVEYLTRASENSAQRWNLYQHAAERGSAWEPWELLDKRIFSDAAAAWEFYLARLLDENTYTVNPVFEEILVDGLTVRESYIEESPAFHSSVASWVCRDTERENRRLLRMEQDFTELYMDFEDFLKKLYGSRYSEFLENFRKFKESRNNEGVKKL